MPIFDQGYQHWKGALSGHAWRWLAITRQGLRGQLKGSISLIRILLVTALIPALVLVVVIALWGLFEQGSQTIINLLKPILPPGVAADPHAYRHAVWTISYSFFFKFEIFFIMLIVVIAGPNLISRDIRFNALPLYFSRPLTRLDYFLGKLGIIAALVAAVAVLPAVAAYVLGVCFSLDLSVIRDTWRLLPASILYGLVIVVSAGTLMLALSSLSRRSLYVGIAWVGLWVISTAVAGVLYGIHQQTLYRTVWQEEMARGKYVPPDSQPPDPDEAQSKQNRQNRTSGEVWQRVRVRVEQAEAEAAKTNWRPLCSYTSNLERLGEALLNTDAAWVEIGRAVEAPRAALQPLLGGGRSGAGSAQSNNRLLADRIVPQYPWIWSAGVLAGLLGLSIWILTRRVKTLDRLQ
ncbi:MAG: ABC transporter permease subunit [Thermoguttaceae bacterium]|jgi:ABC-2 type transport system permease protein